MSRFAKIFAAVLATVFLFGCGQDSESPTPDITQRAPLTHTLSGTPIPIVKDDKNYLSTAPIDTAQKGKIVYSVNDESSGYVSGTLVQEAGVSSTQVTAVANIGYKFLRWSDGVTDATRSGDTEEGIHTAIFDYEVLDFPIMVINTKDSAEILSKEEYLSSTLSLIACEDEYVLDNVTMGIRGRGNFSWSFDKKSYKFKLDKKENILGIGNGKERTWVLLANHCDISLLRNHLAMELGRSFDGITWEPASVSVDVYLNGEYIGVYLLAEEIKISGDRVNISDTDQNAIDTGYLLEMSNYAKRGGIHTAGRAHNIHTQLSDNEEIKDAQKKYIKGYVDECYKAMKNGDYTLVNELIDLDSFIHAYFLEEVTKNLDSHYDNFYIWKDVGTKLHFGPYWDFDNSLGNANEGAEEYSGIFVGNGKGSDNSTVNWFPLAMLHEWYRQMVVDEWDRIYPELQQVPEYILSIGEDGSDSYERNFIRWPIFGTQQNRETEKINSLKTYTEHYTYLAEWFENRIEWLNEAFHDEKFVTEGKGIERVEWLRAIAAEESLWEAEQNKNNKEE